MVKSRSSFRSHLLLFIVVEVLFVVILFREIPETHLLTMIGIGHVTYRWVVVLAGAIRERLRHVWQRFLATYLPIVYHVVVHLRVGVETIHSGEARHPWEDLWIIVWAIVAWGIILWGEILLHRRSHCETHHVHAHKHCEDEGHDDCEDEDMNAN